MVKVLKTLVRRRTTFFVKRYGNIILTPTVIGYPAFGKVVNGLGVGESPFRIKNLFVVEM